MSLLSFSAASSSSNHMCFPLLVLVEIGILFPFFYFLKHPIVSRHNMCCSLKFHVGKKHRISLLLFPETSGTANTFFSPYMGGNKDLTFLLYRSKE